jgi:RecB family exonuclease
VGPIKFWSFSALTQFEKCPYSIYLSRIEKASVPERAEDHPLERGNRVHQAAELYVKGEGQMVRELSKFASEFERLREGYGGGTVMVEESWWFKSDWSPAEGWEDPDKWLIVKCDVAEWTSDQHMDVIDWKTGKSWGKEISHGSQMQLYAIAAFMRFPQLATTRVRLGYLDEKSTYKEKTYDRSKVGELATRFAARGSKLVEAQHFPPKANKSNCRFCEYGPTNGTGACAFGIEV